jgi:putative protease
MANRDANRGSCTHPCRWKYHIVEESRPDEYMPVYEGERGTFIFNSKDLCMIEHIPQLLEAKIDSFKVEGRMKNALYVATVARTYRKAIDDYLQSPEIYQRNMFWYLEQIANCTYRQFTTGFLLGNQDETSQIYDNNTYERNFIYLGVVDNVEIIKNLEEDSIDECQVAIEQRNKFFVGEVIEIMKPNGENIEAKVIKIIDHEGQEQESAPHPQQKLIITLDKIANQYDILRKKSFD